MGFQRLVAEVGLGNVGLVLGIEMSRLARSCRDWHQLLEICALFDTLIADADGVYDPAHYNDRLLLGLKGTMSEAELHILKARMLAGRKAKAGRGELGKPVPMGYVRRPSGEVAFDPDEQAQTTIRLVFDLFDRFRTVGKVMTYLVEHEIRMPVRSRSGPQKGDLEWRRVNRASLLNLFANPIYAGVYAYGVRAVDKRRQKPGRPGTGRRPPRSGEAEVFLHDCLPAYISFERYRRNQAQLQSNRAAWGGAPRAGTALLSGVLVCGRCGLRMLAQYNNNGHTARYVCQAMKSSYGDPFCQSLKARPLDDLIATSRSRSDDAGGDRGQRGARRKSRSRTRGAGSSLASEAGARGIRGRTRAPAVCGRGAGEQAGGAYARTRLGGGSDRTGAAGGGLRTSEAHASPRRRARPNSRRSAS